MTETVVNMAEHFDVDNTLEKMLQERYSMQPVVIAAFRQAGSQAALKLLRLVESESFDKLPIADQLKVFEMVFNRAYGRSETASSSMLAMQKTGQLDGGGDHANKLKQIEQRMLEKGAKHPEFAKVPTEGPNVPDPVGNRDGDVTGKTEAEIISMRMRSRRRKALAANG